MRPPIPTTPPKFHQLVERLELPLLAETFAPQRFRVHLLELTVDVFYFSRLGGEDVSAFLTGGRTDKIRGKAPWTNANCRGRAFGGFFTRLVPDQGPDSVLIWETVTLAVARVVEDNGVRFSRTRTQNPSALL